MTQEERDFFLASAGVAGTLIGLLFVAISVSAKDTIGPDATEIHALQAAAAFTAFTNSFAVSLFALVPGFTVGGPATAVAVVGFAFVAGALARGIPAWRAKRMRLSESTFLVGLLVVFVIQFVAGLALDARPNDAGSEQTICVLVVVCFLIGIARAWALVGGPSMSIGDVLVGRWRSRQRQQGSPSDGE